MVACLKPQNNNHFKSSIIFSKKKIYASNLRLLNTLALLLVG